VSRGRGPGALALVLHTHMPYVEGFGTWPFGEEWLWEAIATSYLPLLDVLERPGGAALTVSLTPVLGDQLEAPGVIERCLRFLREVRPESHALDIAGLRAAGEPALATELERSSAEYAAAADRLAALPGGLGAALSRHASWTSSATHAVLPLLATDRGVRLQLETGIGAHRRRADGWAGGLWLPECAHAGWLDPLLEAAGVRATCVELTGLFGLGDERHLWPLQTVAGPVLWPVDRASMALVWDERGYPSHPAYRDYHHRTEHHHHVHANDGAAYDPGRAVAQARADAADFVARAGERVAGGGVCVVALDTELLGHWWYEGPVWLGAVLDAAAEAGLALTALDDALLGTEPVPISAELPVTSWGEGGDLRTWSAPPVAELAWRPRTLELRTARAGGMAPARALRELLALQSSDWAFLVTRALSGPYPVQRADGHADGLERALAGEPLAAELGHLAPVLAGWGG
jgi:1,4-alpha-glucan branching enzyme